jgi:FKBP12-rapamycin complex-associated protein
LSAEAFNKVYSEIHARCFALVNSSDLQDKLAGVSAIGALLVDWRRRGKADTWASTDKIVDVLGNDMSRALRLAASVQRAFPCPDPLVMTLAAKVFGALFSSARSRGGGS